MLLWVLRVLRAKAQWHNLLVQRELQLKVTVK